MSEQRTGIYEVMFLISQSAAADFGGVVDHINDLLGRASAEVIAMKKWDERRLAFEIDKQRRGVYILAYIKVPTQNLASFERDCNLSERLLRVLVLKADHLSIEEMQAADAREDLAAEAKLRAQQEAEKRETAGTAEIRKPEAEAEAQPEANPEVASDETAEEPAEA